MLYYETENIKQRMFFFVTIRDQMRLLLQRTPDIKGKKSLISSGGILIRIRLSSNND